MAARRWWLAGAAVVVLVGLSNCAPLRHHEAALVLTDIAAAERPSTFKAGTPTPARAAVHYVVAGRNQQGDLYLPGEGAPRAGVVLVPGAVPEGKDEPRLVAFATTLARARFAVLTPDLPGFRDLRMRPSDARDLADAVAWLVGRSDLAPQGRAGLVAISYSLGPAVLAALEDDVRDRVSFLVGVGGYYDLRRAIRYVTTGYYQTAEGRWRHLLPSEYGVLVLVNAARPYLGPADARLLDRMVERRIGDPKAGLSDLVPALGRAGRAIYDLAVNRDPARFPDLYAALPPGMHADIERLSLHDKPLTRLRARLILVHDRHDPLIPWPESEALAAAVGDRQARLYLLDAILGHADLTLSHVLTWRFLRHELPDVVRAWRAVDALLAERERRD